MSHANLVLQHVTADKNIGHPFGLNEANAILPGKAWADELSLATMEILLIQRGLA